MALFVRNPQVKSSKPLYTLGLNKTILIVGLGNPGKEYISTRHNIGFDCIDSFAKDQQFEKWVNKTSFQSDITDGVLGDSRVILQKPQTYMNLSGTAVKKIIDYFKIPINNVLVIYDELDVNFGHIRTRFGGSSAGHKGVQSVIESIGDSFNRVRIGVGPKTPDKIDSADFVLQKFNKDEGAKLENLRKEVISLVTEFIFAGQLNEETRDFLI